MKQKFSIEYEIDSNIESLNLEEIEKELTQYYLRDKVSMNIARMIDVESNVIKIDDEDIGNISVQYTIKVCAINYQNI